MAFWNIFKRHRDPAEAPPPPAAAITRVRITGISIDPDTCTCSQICVGECPEVLDGDTESGVPRVRPGAEALFESKAREIEAARDVCPVAAIHLETEAI